MTPTEIRDRLLEMEDELGHLRRQLMHVETESDIEKWIAVDRLDFARQAIVRGHVSLELAYDLKDKEEKADA